MKFNNALAAGALTVTVLIAVNSAQAQGTANGPTTQHVIIPTATGDSDVWMGGPNDTNHGPGPYPIDLDPNGSPWIKELYSGPNGSFGGGTLILHESIRNAGTEPWHDWHEINLGGAHGAIWGSVLDLRVNGSSITFNSGVSGNTLTLDGFSLPVLPGDILEIDKEMPVLTDNVSGPNTLILRIAEYPTTNIPEPATGVLVGFGVLAMATCRRRRYTT